MAGTPEATTEVLTVQAAAARAGVSERSIRDWIRDGHVATHTVGKGKRVDRASLDAFSLERARKKLGEAQGGAALVPAATSELGPTLLRLLERQADELAALTAEVAALRALLTPTAEVLPEAAPEPVAEPLPELSGWARWWQQWRIR